VIVSLVADEVNVFGVRTMLSKYGVTMYTVTAARFGVRCRPVQRRLQGRCGGDQSRRRCVRLTRVADVATLAPARRAFFVSCAGLLCVHQTAEVSVVDAPATFLYRPNEWFPAKEATMSRPGPFADGYPARCGG